MYFTPFFAKERITIMSDAVLSQFKQDVKEEKSYSGKKLKIGIIGCGGISGAHMNAYKKLYREMKAEGLIAKN